MLIFVNLYTEMITVLWVWRHVVRQKFADISEERVASIVGKILADYAASYLTRQLPS
jgi:hypothetical protein